MSLLNLQDRIFRWEMETTDCLNVEAGEIAVGIFYTHIYLYLLIENKKWTMKKRMITYNPAIQKQ